MFETHEVVGRSLMGKKCNAKKNLEVSPAVNERKRDAVIGNLEKSELNEYKIPEPSFFLLDHSLISLTWESVVRHITMH